MWEYSFYFRFREGLFTSFSCRDLPSLLLTPSPQNQSSFELGCLCVAYGTMSHINSDKNQLAELQWPSRQWRLRPHVHRRVQLTQIWLFSIYAAQIKYDHWVGSKRAHGFWFIYLFSRLVSDFCTCRLSWQTGFSSWLWVRRPYNGSEWCDHRLTGSPLSSPLIIFWPPNILQDAVTWILCSVVSFTTWRITRQTWSFHCRNELLVNQTT